MKYLICLIIFFNCSLIHAMEGKRPRGKGTKADPILVGSLEAEDTSSHKKALKPDVKWKKVAKKKKVTFSANVKQEPNVKGEHKSIVSAATPVVHKPNGFRYGFERVETPEFVLERIDSERAYLELIDVIFTDAEKGGNKRIFGLTREEAMANVERVRLAKDHVQEIHFGNYQIRDPKDNNRIIGALFFSHVQVSAAKMNYGQEGLVETDFHLVSTLNRKGTGCEVLKKAIDTFVRPNDRLTAMPGVHISYIKFPGGDKASCAFKGLVHKITLMSANALVSNAHANSYYAAGFGAKLWNGELVMSFPMECTLPGPSLTKEQFELVLKVLHKLRSCRDYKMKELTPLSEEQVTVDLQEILTNSSYGKSAEILKQHYISLLAVDEPFTFVTVFDMLTTHFKMDSAELKGYVSAEKANTVLKFFGGHKDVPSPVKTAKLFDLSNDYKRAAHW